MKRISDGLEKIISVVLFFIMTVLVVITFLQVFSRFILHIPIAWSEEVIRMSFVWMISLGSAVAIKENSHLVMDMLTSAVSEKMRKVLRMIVLVLILGVSVILLVAGANYVVRSMGKTAVTMPIPSNCVYIAIPVSAVVMIFYTVEQAVLELNRNRKEAVS